MAKLSKAEWVLLLAVFVICLSGAAVLPANQCPDELARQKLTNWMFTTNTLPTGNEMKTIIMPYGFSYALRPYLSAIIGTLFMKIASLFTASSRVMLLASRMCSVLSVTGCCFFCLRTGRLLFRRRALGVLYTVIICFLPQVLFLGMYQNNDSLSLLAASGIVFFLAYGYARHWSVKSCVGLGIILSVALLSYYTIYGWILMAVFFCVMAVRADSSIERKGRFIRNRILLVAGICFLLAGWFFIRNGILHNGDFLALRAEEVSQQALREQGYEIYGMVIPREEGISFLTFFTMRRFEWIMITVRSFIGMFANMTLCLPSQIYGIYYALLAGGMAVFIAACRHHRMEKRDALLCVTMGLSVLINWGLHFWSSYARDYQPQGRYVITTILAFSFFVCYGLDHLSIQSEGAESPEKRAVIPDRWLIFLWLLLAGVALMVMGQML